MQRYVIGSILYTSWSSISRESVTVWISAIFISIVVQTIWIKADNRTHRKRPCSSCWLFSPCARRGCQTGRPVHDLLCRRTASGSIDSEVIRSDRSAVVGPLHLVHFVAVELMSDILSFVLWCPIYCLSCWLTGSRQTAKLTRGDHIVVVDRLHLIHFIGDKLPSNV